MATNIQEPGTQNASAEEAVGSDWDLSSVDFDNWYAHISQLASSSDATDAVKKATELAARLPGVNAGVGFMRSDDKPLVPITSLICRAGIEEEVAKWQSSLAPAIRDLCSSSDAFHCVCLENGVELIAIGLGKQFQPEAVICVFADTLIESSASLALCMQLLAAEGSGWFSTEGRTHLVTSPESQAGFWECCRADSTAESFKILADGFSSRLRNQMVILGTRVGQRKKFRAEAISGNSKLTRPSQLTTNAESLMAEAAIRDEIRCIDVRTNDAQWTEAEELLFRCATRLES